MSFIMAISRSTFINTDSESFSRLMILMATFFPCTQWTPSFTKPAAKQKMKETIRRVKGQIREGWRISFTDVQTFRPISFFRLPHSTNSASSPNINLYNFRYVKDNCDNVVLHVSETCFSLKFTIFYLNRGFTTFLLQNLFWKVNLQISIATLPLYLQLSFESRMN